MNAPTRAIETRSPATLARMRSADESSLIGSSPTFLGVLEHVSQIAPLDKPVLIIGERGTGKELIAQRLHFLSRRWDRTLVKLNCAALAETLLESELFGHEAGAFTGAQRRHPGRFEQADDGTLFLDELAMTSARVQEKLLRVIEYGEFERVGGRETIRTNVRLVGATNEDLPRLASEGRFREDLLDRLAFDVITLPPLRARREDILPLAEHFAVRMTRELGREYFAGFSERATDRLLNHGWPGNVRELKNVVERAVYRNTEIEQAVDLIQVDPFDSPWRPRRAQAAAVFAKPDCASDAVAEAAAPGRAGAEVPNGPFDFSDAVREFEVGHIQRALESCRFNQRRTAEYLGMTYHQLRGYLRKYRMLERESEADED